MGNLGSGELIIILLVALLSVVPLILTVIALIDILRNEFEGYNKVIWVLVVLFVPILGAILYFVIGRGQRIVGNKI